MAPLLAPYLALRGYGCLQKSAPPPASRGRLDLRSCVAADAPRASIEVTGISATWSSRRLLPRVSALRLETCNL